MLRLLAGLGERRLYWAALALFGITLECAALYYQYVLDEWPCVLCIQIRIWIMAFVLWSILAVFFTRSRSAMRLFHGVNLLIMAALAERSWQVLAIERGWVFGECDMDLGLPSWFALDRWMPWIFEVQTSCGYTPLIIFNITMAEVLLVVSAGLLVLCATLFISSWLKSINYSGD